MKHTVSLAALLVALSVCPELSAQKATLSKELREKAQLLFEKGEQHYKLLEYDKAIESYKEAYRISNSPVLLFNIGQCYRQLGKLEEAKRSYQTFVTEDPKTPYRKEVEKIIISLDQELDTKKLSLDPVTEPTPEVKPNSRPIKTNKPPLYIAALQPKEQAPIKRPPIKLLYAGIAGGAGLGLALGALSMYKAGQAANLQAEATGDLSESLAAYDTAKTLALGADVMYLVALGAIGGMIQWYPQGSKRAFLLQPQSPTQLTLSISY